MVATTQEQAVLAAWQALPPDQRQEALDYMEYLHYRLGHQRPRRKWQEILGAAAEPLAGEDAQTWITRTRRESDEHREQRRQGNQNDIDHEQISVPQARQALQLIFHSISPQWCEERQLYRQQSPLILSIMCEYPWPTHDVPGTRIRAPRLPLQARFSAPTREGFAPS